MRYRTFRYLLTLCLAAALLAAAAPGAAQAADFVFKGRGHGHGVGMSQWGAWAAAKDGKTSDWITQFYYDGAEFGTLAEPGTQVRVKLSSSPWLSVYSITQNFTQVDLKAVTGPVTLVTFSGGDEEARDLPQGTTFSLRPEGGKVLVVTGGETYGPYDAAEVRPGDDGRLGVHFYAGGSAYLPREYWGAIRAEPSGTAGYLNAYNLVSIEKYARSIAEVEYDWADPESPRYALEAVKAQAVASRTYAARMMQTKGFIHDNQWDQVYTGYWGNGSSWDPEGYSVHQEPFEKRFPGLPLAAEETAGEVLRYGGELITSFFSSTNGGYTKEWYIDTYPYLPAKPDPYSLQAPPSNPGYQWERTRSQADLSDTVDGMDDTSGGTVSVGTVERIEIVSREAEHPESHAETLRLVGTAGTAAVDARDFRRLFGYSELRSTLILEIVNPDGSVSTGPDYALEPGEFYDVDAGHMYHDDIERIALEGLVHGYSDGTFRPEDEVTRWQFAKIVVGLHNVLFPDDQIDVVNVETAPFSDVPADPDVVGDESDWVAAAKKAALVLGVDETHFEPHEDVQRDQIATMLVRAMGWVEDAEALSDEVAGFADVAADSPHADSTRYLRSLRVLRGYEDPPGSGTYILKAEEPTMRMHAAVVICRVLDL